MNVVRVPWTSVSFLLYAGGVTVFVSALWLLVDLSDDYKAAAFVGWSLLVFAFLAACAFSFRRAGRPVAAGLFAVSVVAAFAVLVGAFEDWIGWLPDNRDSAFGGFDLSVIVLELATVLFALWALRVFRFPLLVAAAVGSGWFLFTDVVSGGGDWSAIVTIAFGAILLMAALGTNPVYAFWLHAAAGLAIGGGLLWFWHTSDVDWILVAIAGLVYVWFGGAIERSSWVVLGALGLLMSTTHWVDNWFGFPDVFPLFLFSDFGDESPADHPWARPVAYAVLGFVFLLLAFALERRRRAPTV